MAELTRDYTTLQTLYGNLLSKKEESKIAANLERRQIGEQFKLLDPARMPERPFSPNRTMINLGGMVAGLAIGLVLVGLLEYRDVTMKTDDEVSGVLGLPVLAVVPHMQSDKERRRVLCRRIVVGLCLGSTVTACLAVVAYTLLTVAIPCTKSSSGFSERPFDLTPNPRYLVLTDTHREALSNLEYGIASRKGITLLIGEAGSGKTTLIRAAIGHQPDRVHCVHLSNPALTRAEFIEMIAERFSLTRCCPNLEDDAAARTGGAARRAPRGGRARGADRRRSTEPVARASRGARLLANIETESEKLLSVVIAGQPELAERLNDPELRQLKQRIALRCELRPLDAHETAAYLAGRIKAAGGTAAQVFTREAVTTIHKWSGGIPRLISVLADNALLYGIRRAAAAGDK